jgi:hypothetical protein
VAASISPSKVRLTWNKGSSNLTGFKIYRKTNDSNDWTLLSETGPTTFNYIDARVANHQSTTGYSYYIQAFNMNGASPPTGTVCVPFNPSGLTATTATGSNGKIILQWKDNSDNEHGVSVFL